MSVIFNPGISGGGGGGAVIDRELVVSTYIVRTAFTGASIGDTVTATQVLDVTGTPSTVATIWRNQTTAANLASAPSAANLELVGSTALTDAQLRATAVPVSGTVSVSGTVPVSGPLTDTQLRATAVPVSGPLTDTQLRATAVPVSGPLTDTQLRATAVPISAASLPLPADAATSALQTTGNTSLSNIDGKLPALVENRVQVEILGIPQVARQLNATSSSTNTALTTTTRRISMYARNADIRYTLGSSSQTATASSHFIAANERLDVDVPTTPNIAVIRAGTTDGILELTELT